MVTVAQPVVTPRLSVRIQKRFRAAGTPPFQLAIEESFSAGFTVLFGPSGAGKSTLLDCIAGLVSPDEGFIKLDEEVFFDSEKKISRAPQKRGIGYVFQSLALFPNMSVEENASYGLSHLPAADRSEKVERILATFHIQALRRRKPRELSGGEKQRVALARSLVTEPRVLLLDEPLTGLDAGLRQSILQDLREGNTVHRIPILYVTHNREEVNAIGDRVLAIEGGQGRKSGIPGAVLDAPRSAGLAQAAGFENLLQGKVIEHRTEDGVMRVALDATHCELEVPLGTAPLGESVQVAIHAGDILMATHAPHGLSARNILPGTVESVEVRGPLAIVRVNAGARFTVHATRGAMRSLELAPGSILWLVVKTHSCHVVSPQ